MKGQPRNVDAGMCCICGEPVSDGVKTFGYAFDMRAVRHPGCVNVKGDWNPMDRLEGDDERGDCGCDRCVGEEKGSVCLNCHKYCGGKCSKDYWPYYSKDPRRYRR